jgi:UDP-N-acetylenolpyruvoylglucosamine reductase
MNHPRNIFMIGMGGMGMAPLALYLQKSGHRVCGVDASWRAPVRKMFSESDVRMLGAVTEIPMDTDWVVYSSAVQPDHPLLLEAEKLGLECFRRGELLAQISREKNLVAVCGSHGKTSTSGMLITALKTAGIEFDYVLGGLFNGNQFSPANACGSEWLIAEVDESDGTIDLFSPAITVALNLDWDHADRYQTHDALRHAFQMLIDRTSQSVVLPYASQNEIHSPKHADLYTFGDLGDYQYDIEMERSGYLTLKLGGRFPSHRSIVKAMGEFNATNATVALAVCHLMGVTLHKNLLKEYPGVSRRQELLYQDDDSLVFEDYAHHPTELDALCKSLMRNYPYHDLYLIYQPHRYSRTAQFGKDFADVLAKCPHVALMQVYAAGEPPLSNGTSAAIFEHLKNKARDVCYCDSEAALKLWLDSIPVGRRRLVVFVGAGDIEHTAHRYVDSLKGDAPEAKSSTPDWWLELKDSVSEQTLLTEDEPLANKTTMRVGGSARFYAEPVDLRDLTKVLHAAARAGIPAFPLGRGSNIIVSDSGFPGVIVRLSKDNWKQIRVLNDHQIYAGAGARLKQLCSKAASTGMVGFEFLEGIPGTVGGSLRMNAGAMGMWLFDVVEELHLITPGGDFKKLKREEIHAAYRNCSELTENYAVGAILNAVGKDDVEKIKAKIKGFSEKRKQSQPREASAGCVFKNPEGGHAGRLIDDSGLKGFTVGGAVVSPVHANFIINNGTATAQDVIDLVKHIRQQIQDTKGVNLEPEVKLLGAEWKDVLK